VRAGRVATVDEQSFRRVLEGARAGDGRAVDALFAEMQPRFLRYLRASEPSAAEDIASEVWIAISRGLGSFTGTFTQFRAWAFTIAQRRLADHRRRVRRRPMDLPGEDTFAALPAADRPDVDAIGRMSAQDAVDALTSMLSFEQAEVVLLRVLGDLDAAQVGRILGRTEGWVRVNQHRAVKKLATAWASSEL
jgi:RNA polymerase sigma-70 factor, ECF subfamily